MSELAAFLAFWAYVGVLLVGFALWIAFRR